MAYKNKEDWKKWLEKNRDHFDETTRNNFLLKKYGITTKDYNGMFEYQKGCCKLCGTHQSELKTRLDVDHDHKTKSVRGLLCRTCNQGLGLFKEDIELLERAIKYIIKG